MLFARKIILASIMSLSAVAFAQDNCGDTPVAPEIVDGATATMEELVANSESVKAYVADADTYLDCREGYAKESTFNALSDEEKTAFMEGNKAVLDVRNNIGPAFNEQVALYTQAHPQAENNDN